MHFSVVLNLDSAYTARSPTSYGDFLAVPWSHNISRIITLGDYNPKFGALFEFFEPFRTQFGLEFGCGKVSVKKALHHFPMAKHKKLNFL